MTKATIIREMKRCLTENRNTHLGIRFLFDMCTYKFTMLTIGDVFPEYGNDKLVRIFGGNPNEVFAWQRGVWNTGRLDFFNYLYDKYKDDNTEI